MSYILRQLSLLEADEHNLLSRIKYVKCDSLDCMELIIAKEKTIMFREFASNVMHILKIGEFEIKKEDKDKKK